MTAREFDAGLKRLKWTGVKFAARVGKSPRQVSNWRTGKVPVPEYAATVMRLLLLAKEMLDG